MKDYKISGFSDEISSDFETQLRALNRMGIRYTSIRGVGSKNVCEYSADEVKGEIKPLLDKYKIGVSSIGSPLAKIFVNDEEGFDRHMSISANAADTANLLGCRYIRMFSFYIPKDDVPEKWKDIIIEKMTKIVRVIRCKEVMPLLENEKDTYGDSPERCISLFNALGPDIRAIFDFANYVQCGYSAAECYNKLKPYIEYFHIKDAVSDKAENVLCGTGEGQIKTILKSAFEGGYNGFLTLEPHLALFDSLKTLELRKAEEVIRHSIFPDGETAFEAQYNSLKGILKQINDEE